MTKHTSRPDAKVLTCGPSPRGWHRLQTAAECLQKYAWEYLPDPKLAGQGSTKKEAKRSDALVKGSLIHLGLAQIYARNKEIQKGGDPDEWCTPYEAVELVAAVDGDSDLVPIVVQTLEAYERKYLHDLEMWQVEGVEQLGFTYIKESYLLTGRRDLVVRDASGMVYVVDHKTTGRITAKHREYYSISGQLLGYDLMARQQFKDDYAGLILNLIEVGGGKFDRIVLPRSSNLEAQFESRVVDIEQAIERLEAEKRPRDQWPKAMNELTCYTRYGACPHIDKCRYGANASKAGAWEWSDDWTRT